MATVAELRREAGRAAGRRLAKLRQERGWRQAELAGRAGVTQSYVSMLERGAVAHPTRDYRDAIARAFQLDRKDVFGGFETYLAELEATLSLMEAAARFEIDAHALSRLAEARLVRARKMRRRGLGRYDVGFAFDEEQLAEDLARIPRCPWEACDKPKTGEYGCSEHGQKLWAEGRRGTTRPLEVSRRISQTKRENPKPRPDTRERVTAAWDEDRALRDELRASGKLLRPDIAKALRLKPNSVSVLATRVGLPVEHVKGPIGPPHPTIEPRALGAWAYARTGSTAVYGRVIGHKGAAAGIEAGREKGGRPRKWGTPEETQAKQVRIHELDAQGLTTRQIAGEVFGDASLKDRVARYLNA
jgi:transcriptional regulator with XRE-family HTH domain